MMIAVDNCFELYVYVGGFVLVLHNNFPMLGITIELLFFVVVPMQRPNHHTHGIIIETMN